MEQIDSRIEKVRDGELIIKEDSWAYYAYVLQDGKAKVLKNVDGRQVVIGTLGKGDIFGEAGFLGEPKRTTSVVADGDVTVEMIGKDTFMELFNRLPGDVQTKLYAMAGDITHITEIYSRLIILFQRMQDVETNMIDAKAFEMEIEKMPGFMRTMAITIAGRHNTAVERMNRLVVQIEEKQSRLLPPL